MTDTEKQKEALDGPSASKAQLDTDDICGYCGLPGADKMAVWTGSGLYWPVEFKPETEFVHHACEEAETIRAHSCLSPEQREHFIRSI